MASSLLRQENIHRNGHVPRQDILFYLHNIFKRFKRLLSFCIALFSSRKDNTNSQTKVKLCRPTFLFFLSRLNFNFQRSLAPYKDGLIASIIIPENLRYVQIDRIDKCIHIYVLRNFLLVNVW